MTPKHFYCSATKERSIRKSHRTNINIRVEPTRDQRLTNIGTECAIVHDEIPFLEPVLSCKHKKTEIADVEEEFMDMESDSDLTDEEVRFASFNNRRVSYQFLFSNVLYFFVSQLQRDFASGKLHVGLNRLQPQEKTRALYNNVVSLL